METAQIESEVLLAKNRSEKKSFVCTLYDT